MSNRFIEKSIKREISIAKYNKFFTMANDKFSITIRIPNHLCIDFDDGKIVKAINYSKTNYIIYNNNRSIWFETAFNNIEVSMEIKSGFIDNFTLSEATNEDKTNSSTLEVYAGKTFLLGVSSGTEDNIASLREDININKTAINTNKAAINIINGNETTEGSIAKTVKDEITKIIGGASEAYDTLKEVEDYITSHQGEVTESILPSINNNKSNIKELSGSYYNNEEEKPILSLSKLEDKIVNTTIKTEGENLSYNEGTIKHIPPVTTSKTLGDNGEVTETEKLSFKVPKIGIDSNGHINESSDTTINIPSAGINKSGVITAEKQLLNGEKIFTNNSEEIFELTTNNTTVTVPEGSKLIGTYTVANNMVSYTGDPSSWDGWSFININIVNKYITSITESSFNMVYVKISNEGTTTIKYDNTAQSGTQIINGTYSQISDITKSFNSYNGLLLIRFGSPSAVTSEPNIIYTSVSSSISKDGLSTTGQVSTPAISLSGWKLSVDSDGTLVIKRG